MVEMASAAKRAGRGLLHSRGIATCVFAIDEDRTLAFVTIE
jgi:hypothetical protein